MKSGFTLIEAMIALMLLTVGLLVLLTGASRCLAVMRSAKNYQTAQWVMGCGEAEHPLAYTNDITDLVVDPPITYLDTFKFGRTVKEKDESLPEERKDYLYIITTRVSWSEKGDEASEEVVRYIYEPKKK